MYLTIQISLTPPTHRMSVPPALPPMAHNSPLPGMIDNKAPLPAPPILSAYNTNAPTVNSINYSPQPGQILFNAPPPPVSPRGWYKGKDS